MAHQGEGGVVGGPGASLQTVIGDGHPPRGCGKLCDGQDVMINYSLGDLGLSHDRRGQDRSEIFQKKMIYF